MITRNLPRWLLPLFVLALRAIGVAYATRRSLTPSALSGVAAADAKIPLGGESKKHTRPRPATACPKTDTSRPGATKWIKYPTDNVLPSGICIGICDDVIVGVVSEDLNHPDYDLMCTRYVVGDLDRSEFTMQLWRCLDLGMPKPDGSISKLSVLRPL